MEDDEFLRSFLQVEQQSLQKRQRVQGGFAEGRGKRGGKGRAFSLSLSFLNWECV